MIERKNLHFEGADLEVILMIRTEDIDHRKSESRSHLLGCYEPKIRHPKKRSRSPFNDTNDKIRHEKAI